MNDDVFLRELVQETRNKYDAQREADKRFNMEEESRKTLSNYFWNDLITWLDAMVKRFNAEVGGPFVLTLAKLDKQVLLESAMTRTTRKKITVSYDEAKRTLSWSESNAQRTPHEFIFSLSGDGNIVATSSDDGLSKTVSEVGQEILNYLTL